MADFWELANYRDEPQSDDLTNECTTIGSRGCGEEGEQDQSDPVNNAAFGRAQAHRPINWDDWGSESDKNSCSDPPPPHANSRSTERAHESLNYSLAKGEVLETCPYYGHQVR